MDDAFLRAPLLQIGAGRSGSTLFRRLMDAHPQVSFLGETSFLLPRLWQQVWEDRFWLDNERFVQSRPGSSRDPRPAYRPDEMEAERERAAAHLRAFVGGLLGVREGSALWGFKEIWNGQGRRTIDWSAYDHVFPDATYVHLVRNPFAFVRSHTQWFKDPPTLPRTRCLLRDWVLMLDHNRTRAETERFHEIRFEDLAQEPAATLEPILASRGLAVGPEMLRDAGRKLMGSASPTARATSARTLSRGEVEALVEGVPGLRVAMLGLGYDVPSELAVVAEPFRLGGLRRPLRALRALLQTRSRGRA